MGTRVECVVPRVMAAFGRRIFQHLNAGLLRSGQRCRLSSVSKPMLSSVVSSPEAKEHISAEGYVAEQTTLALRANDFFQVSNSFSVEDLFNARVHLGHKEGSLDPHMNPFIFGSRLGHLILDLDQTAEHLRTA